MLMVRRCILPFAIELPQISSTAITSSSLMPNFSSLRSSVLAKLDDSSLLILVCCAAMRTNMSWTSEKSARADRDNLLTPDIIISARLPQWAAASLNYPSANSHSTAAMNSELTSKLGQLLTDRPNRTKLERIDDSRRNQKYNSTLFRTEAKLRALPHQCLDCALSGALRATDSTF